jgi:hypothetical protein
MTLFDSLDQSALLGADSSERVLKCDPPLERRCLPLLYELHGPVDGRFQDGGIERGGDGVEDRAFEGLLGHVQMVRHTVGAALAVVGATVEEAAPATVVAAHGDQGAGTQRAAAEPAQKVGRGEIETGPRVPGRRPGRIPRARQAPVRGVPEFGRDDSQILRREPQPFGGGALSLGLGASADDLLAAVPDDDAVVEVAGAAEEVTAFVARNNGAGAWRPIVINALDNIEARARYR